MSWYNDNTENNFIDATQEFTGRSGISTSTTTVENTEDLEITETTADTATQMMDYIKSTIESNETLMEQLPLSLACGAMGLCILFPSYLFPILPMSIIIGTAYGIYRAPAVMSFAALVVVLFYFAFTYWLHLEWVRILYLVSY